MLGIATAALSPTPGRSVVVPGFDAVWDDCCKGTCWVRLVSIAPLSVALSGAKMGGHPCARTWATTIGMGVVRCIGTVDDRGRPPSVQRITADGRAIVADQQALCSAALCNFGPLGMIDLVRWDALPAEGGCAGGEWTVLMRTVTYDCTGP
jgi:hypothetical protein